MSIAKASFVSLFFLTACNASEPSPEKFSSLICPKVYGVDVLFSDEGPEVIVVGESHGMQEPPALVDALVCHSLSRGLNTGLALEVDYDGGRYDSYLSSEGTDVDRKELFDSWMWKGEFTDGRSSVAMLSLLDQARIYQRQEHALTVIAFKAEGLEVADYLDRSAYTQAYEKLMADNILEGARGLDKTIVLVGNLHARRGRRDRGTNIYDYMGTHMPAPQTMTFTVVHTGGTSWNCRGPEPKDCGEHTTGRYVSAESDLAKTGDFRFIFNSDDDEIAPFIGRQYTKDWFDGVIYVGDVTASPPANLDGRIPYFDEKEAP